METPTTATPSFLTPSALHPVVVATGTVDLAQTSRQLQRVLHVINGEHFSGAERVQQLLGKQLPVFGFEARFACVKPGKFRQCADLAEHLIIDAPMRGRFDLSVVNRLTRYIRSHEISLLHAHTPRTAMLTSLIALWTGLPWIYHVHSPTARDSTRGFVNRMNSLIERYSIRSCNCLITVSQSLSVEMRRLGVKPERVVTVANGVPAIEPIDALARLTRTDWRFGIVALMRPRKGVEVALQAMRSLKHAGNAVRLQLIGGFETAEYEQQILSLIDQLDIQDCVDWTGFTNNVPAAIRELDALLLPSLFGEGMPMVVLEALAAAVPVIATRVEGTPEVIRHNCEGLLAEPQSAEDLARQIQHMIADRRAWAEMSFAALARHRDSFGDSRMAEGVANAYRHVLQSVVAK